MNYVGNADLALKTDGTHENATGKPEVTVEEKPDTERHFNIRLNPVLKGRVGM
jgi:hypothetical protein